MTKGDAAVERAANRLQGKAEEFAAQGGSKAKLADSLAEDAEFLRKLKPSLMVARAKGLAPTNEKHGQGRVAPSGPQLGNRPTRQKRKGKGGGPSPWLVIGVALFAGIVLAKAIDWRGHAHPRD